MLNLTARSLFNTGWNWDLNLSHARLDQQATVYGYLNIRARMALGPSFRRQRNPPAAHPRR
jgi:hypothetical protein